MSFGLVKHNNNSISAITTPGSLAQGKMILIKEQTASSSSSISFVDGSSSVVFDNTYPIYLFKFINIHPATNSTDFDFQVSTNGGSAYGVDITSTWFQSAHNESDTTTGLSYETAEDLAQSTSFQTLNQDIKNDADSSNSGELYVFNPSSTTFVKHFMAVNQCMQSTPYSVQSFCDGYVNTTSAIDGIQFKMSSGNIDSGTIKLYGIKGS